MNTATLADRENLKAALRELVQEEPDFLLELLEKVAKEKAELNNNQKVERKKRIEALVRKDFDKYAEVFKALA